MKTQKPRPKPARSRVPRSSAPRPRRRKRGAAAAPAPVDPVRAVVAQLSGPLLEWWDYFWPFGKEIDGLAVLSGRVPAALAQAFPLESPKDSFALLESVVREEQAIAKGHNEKFEQVVTELAPLGIPRGKLIDLTACSFLPAYRWALSRSDKIERMRPNVNKLAHRLRETRKYLTAAPFSGSPWISSVTTAIDALLDYLAGIPTKGALRTWRRKHGINRRGPDLWKLKDWTQIARTLVQSLRTAQTGALRRRVADARLERKQFAEHYAHALLYARYPHEVDPDWRKLASRVNRP